MLGVPQGMQNCSMKNMNKMNNINSIVQYEQSLDRRLLPNLATQIYWS